MSALSNRELASLDAGQLPLMQVGLGVVTKDEALRFVGADRMREEIAAKAASPMRGKKEALGALDLPLFGHAAQPDLFASAATVAVDPPKSGEPWRCELTERLCADGHLTAYSTFFGYCQTDVRHSERAAPWNAPTRFYLFPCVWFPSTAEASARLVVRHEKLMAHPYVAELEAASGISATLEPDSHTARHGTYHHAVDLIAKGMWREAMQDFGTIIDTEALLCAVAYGLDYGEDKRPHISAADARILLDGCGLSCPDNVEGALRIVSLDEFADDKGKPRRTIHWKSGPGQLANVWGRIVGMERGWFKHDRAGFVTFTDAAKRRDGNLI